MSFFATSRHIVLEYDIPTRLKIDWYRGDVQIFRNDEMVFETVNSRVVYAVPEYRTSYNTFIDLVDSDMIPLVRNVNDQHESSNQLQMDMLIAINTNTDNGSSGSTSGNGNNCSDRTSSGLSKYVSSHDDSWDD
jgi:hypothetical protein